MKEIVFRTSWVFVLHVCGTSTQLVSAIVLLVQTPTACYNGDQYCERLKL
ncbi:hypothetical protein [Ktedonobacter racemifer]|uniref:Uncharacterized protein n=1 Tax=Ktedonobacter racemifer DSM 44963 TaxID=485913 RepID=D6TMM7_KTERA|nr:hypothetical protein [Ktedonobacter racemifer]EFH87027.1 hypothetical protein Krac_8348 [Ktedonobacter racemifer DSM 44963]